MHITRTKVEMSSVDVLGVINEYFNIPNLKLSDIIIDESIIIKGSYKLGGRISFSVKATVISYKSDLITFKLDEIKLGKVGVFNLIKRFAISKLLSELKLSGLSSDKDTVVVEVKKILDKLPFYLDFDLQELTLGRDNLVVIIENIKFSMKKVESIQQIKEKIQLEDSSISITQFSINRVQDSYSKIRSRIESRVPSGYDKLLSYVLVLPDIISLFYRLFKDERVPFKIKVTVGAVITYLASPIDILPDYIPFIGKVDDLSLIFYALSKIFNNISPNIIKENWQGDYDTLEKVKGGIKYISIAAGGTNVDKLFKYILKMYEFSKENKDNYSKDLKREK